jgi:mannose-6-phosphate isomerase-like protein (cupin superfamily)
MGTMRYLGAACWLMMCGVGCAQVPSVALAGTGDLSKARVFTPEQGTVRVMANGGESRSILHAALATGEVISVHESIQAPGTKPNPPHRIQHSELIVVREGTLVFEHDGLSEQAGPGSIIYVAYGTLHTVRNIGNNPAKYLVIAIGGDQKP